MKLPNLGAGNPNFHRMTPDRDLFGNERADSSLNKMLNFNNDGTPAQFAGSFMAGGQSTVPGWSNSFDIHDLHKKISAVTPNSSIITDPLGRQAIQIQQGSGDNRTFAHIHLDAQTGGIAVNNAKNPGGGFFVQDRITNMTPLMNAGTPFQNKQDFLQAATSLGVFESRTDVLLNSIRKGENIVTAAQRNAVIGQAQEDGSPYTSYNPMETSPQMRVRMATSIGLPSTVQRQDGTFSKAYGSDYMGFLNQTGAGSFFGVKGSSARLLDLEATSGSNYSMMDNGMYDMNKVKRDTQQGVRESLSLYNNPSPLGRVDPMTSPFRLSGSPEADQGYKQNVLYPMHNLLTPEGQGFIRENAGLLRKDFARTIPLPEGGVGALGISTNTLYGDMSAAEGQSHGGNMDRLEQLLGKRFGSYNGVSVDSISVNEQTNMATIMGGSYIPVTGSSFKYKQKTIGVSTPDSSGIIPQGYDAVMPLSGADDLMGLGSRGLASRYDSTDTFKQAFRSYAVGYDNLNETDRGWADQHASWIKGASGAGGFTSAQADSAFGNGVIGFKGSSGGNILGAMSRDFAMSNMAVHEWNDQFIDASTYEMHKDKMVDGKPMLDMSLHSGEGDSAVYKGTVRDYAISAEVMTKIQPEFAKDTATLKAESLDRMARYQPGMYNYLKGLDQGGNISNPARDIITATRSNYEGSAGAGARAALSGNRSPISLDSADHNINLSGIHSEVTSSMEGASSDEINQEFLKRVGDITGDHALQVGGYTLPSAKAALSTYTLGPDGTAVGNLGSALAKTLVAQGNVQTAASLGGGEEYSRARDAGAYETLSEAAELMSPDNPNDSAKEFIRSATGMKVPVIAGAATASKAVPLGTTVIDQNELFRVTGARNSDEQQQVLAHIMKGSVGVMNTMYPEGNSQNASIRNRIMTTQQFNKMMGGDVLSTENKMYVNEGTAFALSKDFDADYIQGLVSGQFTGEGDNRRFEKAEGWKANTPSEINQLIEQSVGGEIGKQREKADVTLADYIGGVKAKPKSLGDIGRGYMETMAAKAQMGPMYNMGIRMFNQVANVLSDRAGLDPQGTEARRVQKAMSGFSQSFYQAAIDLEASDDPALQRLGNMSKTLSMESAKSPYGSSAFFAKDGKGVEIAGGGNKSTLAASVMETIADVGLNPNLQGADRSAAADKYRKFLAPHIAVGMSPIDSTDEQRAGAESMLMAHADAYERGEDRRLDTQGFARTVGKNDPAHWLYGNKDEGLGSSVPLAAAISGKMAQRSDDKNPNRKGVKLGLQSAYQGIVSQVGAFFGGHDARSFEEYAASTATQAPEITPHTQYTVGQMGGAGAATASPSGLLSYLNPANQSTPHIPESEMASSAPPEYMGGNVSSSIEPPAYEYTDDDVPYQDGYEALPSSGGGGARKPPASIAAAAAMPSEPTGGRSGSTPLRASHNHYSRETPQKSGGDTIIQQRNVIAGLKENDVTRAYGSLEYLQSNQSQIGELREYAENGGDYGKVSGRVDAIIKASSSVQGVYNIAGQRRAAGMNMQHADDMASAMFEPGTDKHVDAFMNQSGADINALVQFQAKGKLAQTEARTAKEGAVPAGLDASTIGEANGHIEKFITSMSKLGEITEGVTKGQSEYIKQSHELIKNYDTMAKAAETITKRGDSATPEEKSLLARAQGVGLEWNKDAIDDLKRTTGYMESSGQVKPEPMDPADRQDRLVQALMRGGVSGNLSRRKAEKDGLYEGGLDVLGFNVEDTGTINAIGGGMRLAGHARNMLWATSHIQSQIIAPMMAQMNTYGQSVESRDTMLVQSGAMSYGDMMSGATGDYRRRQARSVIAQEEAGRQVFNTYNGLASSIGSDQLGRLQGAATSIGSPAISAGVIATQLGIGTLALPAMLGVGAVAGAAWLNGASHDDKTVTPILQQMMKDSRGKSLLQGFGNSVGDMIKDPTGSAAALWSVITDPANAARQKSMASMQTELESSMGMGAGQQYISNGKIYETTAQPGDRNSIVADIAKRYGVAASTVNAAAFDSYKKDAANRGVSESAATSIYGFNQIYGNQFAPSSPLVKSLEQLEGSGFSGASDRILGIAASQGISPTNASGVYATGVQMTDYLNNLPPGTPPALALQRLDNTTARNNAVNPMLRKAGLIQRGKDFYGTGHLFSDDPDQQDALDQVDYDAGASLFDNQQYSGLMGGKTAQSFVNRQTALISQKNYIQQAREATQYKRGEAAFTQAQGYGAGDDVAAAYVQSSTLNEKQMSVFNLMAGGDRLALSQNANIASKYKTMDANTGLGAYVDNINASEFSDIKANDKYGRFNISAQEAAGGTRGLQDLITTSSRNMDTFQFQQGQYQRGMSYGMMTGGGAINQQGYATGGDQLNGVSSVFQQMGMTFNKGNGMGYWQLEDAGVKLQREQQSFSMQQQTQSIQLDQQQFQMSGQQHQQQYGLSVAQFQYDTGYQQQQMGIDRSHQLESRQWQQEDLSYNKDVSQVQFGFQMRDFDRNIRYARGRDRLDLMRQKDDTTILHSMEMGQDDKQQSRFETQNKWEDDKFTREEDHFKKETSFQQQSMTMSEQFYAQNRTLEKQRLDMAKLAHDKEITWLQQGWAQEDQRRLLDRQAQIAQNAMANDMAIKMREATLEQNKWSDAITLANDTLTREDTAITNLTATGKLAVIALDAVTVSLANVTAAAGGSTAPVSSPSPTAPHVLGGGQSIATQGISVVHSDNPQQVKILTDIHNVLKDIKNNPAIVNATITTNQQRVKVGSALTLLDSAYGNTN